MGFWIVVASIAALAAIFKLYYKFITGIDRSMTCLVGKTAIVTGANTGIGFYTAQDFAKRGARVILACRNREKAEEARDKIIKATDNPNVVVRIVDLISLASVRRFAKEINATESRLDILVNNAGAGGFEHMITADGLSMSMQINHFGPFLLTLLLIVNVSSDIANIGEINLDDLNGFPNKICGGLLDYANTNLCKILFANELAQRLNGSEVYANAVHPGAIKTDFIKNFPLIPKIVLTILSVLFFKSAEEGAQTSIYAAVSIDIEGISGAYFADCKKYHAVKGSHDEYVAKKLWEKSEEFVKLTRAEKSL